MALKEIDTSGGKKLDSENMNFEDKGDSVEGVLLEKVTLTSKKNGKTFQKYTVRTSDNRNVSFLGGHQIDKGLAQVDTGTLIRITYKGEQKLDGGRRLKTYKIEADDAPSAVNKKTAAEVVAAARA